MRIEEFPVQNAKPGQVLPLQNANIPNMNIRYNSSGDATCWPTTCNLHVVAKPTFTQKMYHLVPPMRFAFCTELWLVDKFHSIQPYSSIFIHGHDCTVMLPACKCYHMLSKFPEKYTWIYTILNPLYHQRDLKHFGRWSAKCIPLPIRGVGLEPPI